jgi:hypothetical protein
MGKGPLALLCAAAVAAAALASAAARSWAEGAIAMGTTGNVVRDGIAFGMVVNEPKDQAAGTAIDRCRSFQARAAAERCKVVATFSRQCYAVAYDPQPGTPGAGWGVGVDQLAANQKAVAMCEEAAGPARKGYCEVASAGCDTLVQTEAAPSAAPQRDNAVSEGPKPQPVSPAPSAEPRQQAREKQRGSWLGTGTPAFLVAVMGAVGAAYGLGQLARGKLRGGLKERQVVKGVTLAIAAGAIIKLLELAGSGEAAITTVAGVLVLAAAVFA